MISTSEQNGPSQRAAGTQTASTATVPSVRVIDLCCGLGGLALSAKQVGLNVVAGVDLNATALKTFQRNFSDAKVIEGSVRSTTILKRCHEFPPFQPRTFLGAGLFLVPSPGLAQPRSALRSLGEARCRSPSMKE
jgi:hypothetical protein